VHDIKQKGRANPLKNQGLRPIVPAAKQRKETGLSQKSGVLAPSGTLVPAASWPATPRGLGISGKRKGPETFRAFYVWWSWRDLNPRPQTFFEQFYMCSRLI